MFTGYPFQFAVLDCWRSADGRLLFTLTLCVSRSRPAGEKFREVMQTYIKYCGGKQVLTGLWKIGGFRNKKGATFVAPWTVWPCQSI
jgi:hypothetical protein